MTANIALFEIDPQSTIISFARTWAGHQIEVSVEEPRLLDKEKTPECWNLLTKEEVQGGEFDLCYAVTVKTPGSESEFKGVAFSFSASVEEEYTELRWISAPPLEKEILLMIRHRVHRAVSLWDDIVSVGMP